MALDGTRRCSRCSRCIVGCRKSVCSRWGGVRNCRSPIQHLPNPAFAIALPIFKISDLSSRNLQEISHTDIPSLAALLEDHANVEPLIPMARAWARARGAAGRFYPGRRALRVAGDPYARS